MTATLLLTEETLVFKTQFLHVFHLRVCVCVCVSADWTAGRQEKQERPTRVPPATRPAGPSQNFTATRKLSMKSRSGRHRRLRWTTTSMCACVGAGARTSVGQLLQQRPEALHDGRGDVVGVDLLHRSRVTPPEHAVCHTRTHTRVTPTVHGSLLTNEKKKKMKSCV